jgi:serine protease DegQ
VRATRGSPAEKSGLKLGDIIVSINGRTIPDVNTALNTIAEVPPGKSVGVKVIRRNQEMTLDVLVGKRRPRARPEQ